MAKIWEAQAHSSPTTEAYEKRLAELWRETGCAAEGAPYVLRGLIINLTMGSYFHSPFSSQSPHLPTLAKAFLDEEHCPGARGLSDINKAHLKEIRDRAPSPASKQ